MQVTSYRPSKELAPFVRRFTVVESADEATRVLMPVTGLIAGFRFSGSATQLDGGSAVRMPDAAMVGFLATTRRMQTSAGGGVVLAIFREGGAAQFFREPLHELFGRTVALDDLIPHRDTDEARTRIAGADDHRQRVALFDEFLLRRLSPRAPDPIVTAALRQIHHARGAVRIRELARGLAISHDRLEKRFRRNVGASPKQYASMIRLRHAIHLYTSGMSLTRAAIEAGYFDQSHFNRDFRLMTGVAPQQFFTNGDRC